MKATRPSCGPSAATLGLAWGLSREGLLELDFLNPKKPILPQEILRRRLRIGGIAAAIVLLGAVSYVVADRVKLGGELDVLLEENAKLWQDVRANREVDFKRMEALEWDDEACDGIWLDHLLQLTREMDDPGKKMVVTHVDFSLKNQAIILRLECADSAAALDYAERLNALTTEDGKPLYRARPGKWQQGATSDPKFKGKTEVRVELLQLTERTSLKQREREYRTLRNKD